MRTRFRRRVGTPGPSPGSPRQMPGFHLARGSRPRGPEWREAAGALRGSAARGQRQAACVRSLVCGELGGGACSSPEARGRLSSFPPQGTSFLVPAPLCFLEPWFPPPNQKLAPLGVPRFCCGISFGAGWGRWGGGDPAGPGGGAAVCFQGWDLSRGYTQQQMRAPGSGPSITSPAQCRNSLTCSGSPGPSCRQSVSLPGPTPQLPKQELPPRGEPSPFLPKLPQAHGTLGSGIEAPGSGRGLRPHLPAPDSPLSLAAFPQDERQ